MFVEISTLPPVVQQFLHNYQTRGEKVAFIDNGKLIGEFIMPVQVKKTQEAIQENSQENNQGNTQQVIEEDITEAIQPSYAKGDFSYDLERMKQAVEAPTILVPKFDTSEQLLEWMLSRTAKDFSES